MLAKITATLAEIIGNVNISTSDITLNGGFINANIISLGVVRVGEKSLLNVMTSLILTQL